jgi:hypothetical protein
LALLVSRFSHCAASLTNHISLQSPHLSCRTHLFLPCTISQSPNELKSTQPSFARSQYLRSRQISPSTPPLQIKIETVVPGSLLVGSSSSPRNSLIKRLPVPETCGSSSPPDNSSLVSMPATAHKERIGHRGRATTSFWVAGATHPLIPSSMTTRSAGSSSCSTAPNSPGPTPRAYPSSCAPTHR